MNRQVNQGCGDQVGGDQVGGDQVGGDQVGGDFGQWPKSVSVWWWSVVVKCVEFEINSNFIGQYISLF